jgi:hypothetical protein
VLDTLTSFASFQKIFLLSFLPKNFSSSSNPLFPLFQITLLNPDLAQKKQKNVVGARARAGVMMPGRRTKSGRMRLDEDLGGGEAS